MTAINKDNNNSSESIISFLPACCKNKHSIQKEMYYKLCRKFKKYPLISSTIFVSIMIIMSQCKLLEITSQSVPYKWCLQLKNIKPKKGDLCVLDYKGKTVVKYLMGKAGDSIRIDGNYILVNGKTVGIIFTPKKQKLISSGTVPEGKVFVLGTHVDSFDSRYKEFGFIEESDLRGKAIGLKKW